MHDEQPKQSLLVVDDSPENIDVIVELLRGEYKIKVARNGKKALIIAESDNPPDLILLDVIMPEMDGYAVCQRLKDNKATKDIPVIFLTGKNEVTDEEKGFKLGAVDYITKPFKPMIVKARVRTHMDLVKQRKKSERLLENILPRKVIQDLKETGKTKPESFENVTLLFSDLVDFTSAAATMAPVSLIAELTEIFTAFDEIVEWNECERIKTIGDAYLAVCGIPQPNPNHARNIINCAVTFISYMKERNDSAVQKWKIRIGVHTGNVVGGIVGKKKYIYDVLGDTVNTASRIETSAEPMRISISESTYDLVKDFFEFEERGAIELKGKGKMPLYYVKSE